MVMLIQGKRNKVQIKGEYFKSYRERKEIPAISILEVGQEKSSKLRLGAKEAA